MSLTDLLVQSWCRWRRHHQTSNSSSSSRWWHQPHNTPRLRPSLRQQLTTSLRLALTTTTSDLRRPPTRSRRPTPRWTDAPRRWWRQLQPVDRRLAHRSRSTTRSAASSAHSGSVWLQSVSSDLSCKAVSFSPTQEK